MAGRPEDELNELAERMADAVDYLSAVARDAGLEAISCDLLRVRRKLRRRPVQAPASSEPVLTSRRRT